MFGKPDNNAHVAEEFQVELRLKDDDPMWPMSRLAENMKTIKQINAWLSGCTNVIEIKVTRIQTIRTDVTDQIKFKPGNKK